MFYNSKALITKCLKNKWFIALLLGSLMLIPTQAHSKCTTLTSGPIELKVNSCKSLRPQKGSNSINYLPSWINDLDNEARRKLLNQHTGVLLEGEVTESTARTKGLNEGKGALKGKTIKLFVHANKGIKCNSNTKFVRGKVKETCCDGGGNAPCLWKTGYYLTEAKASKKSKFSGSKTVEKLVQGMSNLYRNKEYKKLIGKYGYRAHEFKNDVEFQYYLGDSYYKLENCNKAKKNFNAIYMAYGNQKANLAHKNKIRKAIYKLAACRAMEGDAAGAVLILDGMRLDMKFFKNELVKVKYDPDFGRIKKSKEWNEFISK